MNRPISALTIPEVSKILGNFGELRKICANYFRTTKRLVSGVKKEHKI